MNFIKKLFNWIKREYKHRKRLKQIRDRDPFTYK